MSTCLTIIVIATRTSLSDDVYLSKEEGSNFEGIVTLDVVRRTLHDDPEIPNHVHIPCCHHE